jgi:hypothetical protein
MLGDKDANKAKRVMEAMLQMDKIDIKTLREAYEHEAGGSEAETPAKAAAPAKPSAALARKPAKKTAKISGKK